MTVRNESKRPPMSEDAIRNAVEKMTAAAKASVFDGKSSGLMRDVLAALLDPGKCETCAGSTFLPCDDECCVETRSHSHERCPNCTNGTRSPLAFLAGDLKPIATQWTCSTRCIRDGGPHDDSCRRTEL